MKEVLPDIERWRALGQGVALATVTSTDGSTPRPVGAKMAVNSLGEFAGSVSGGCVEGAVIEAARRVIKTGESTLVQFGIPDESAWDVGLSCGGSIKVFIEKIV